MIRSLNLCHCGKELPIYKLKLSVFRLAFVVHCVYHIN